MSVSITNQKRTVPGASFRKTQVVTLDASYPNPAGYVLAPATFGLTKLTRVCFSGAASLAAGLYEPVLVPTFTTDGLNDIASLALHLIVGTTGAEVANGVNVSTVALLIEVEGV